MFHFFNTWKSKWLYLWCSDGVGQYTSRILVWNWVGIVTWCGSGFLKFLLNYSTWIHDGKRQNVFIKWLAYNITVMQIWTVDRIHRLFFKGSSNDLYIQSNYGETNWCVELLDMFIKKGKLCDLLKTAKNWFSV